MNSFWDQRYSEQPAVYGWEPNEFLVSVADRIPVSSRIVCLGEGYGRNGLWLAGLGHRVTIVDSSQVGIDQANEKARELGLRIDTVCEDLADYSPPACDAVVAIFIHLPSDLRPLVHKRAYDALSSGGLFVLECFRKEQIHRDSGGPRDSDLLYSEADLKSDFPDADFDVLSEVTVEMREGKYHSGPAETIRMLARKLHP